jgi:hypothetical protein
MGSGGIAPLFLNSAIEEGEWSPSRPGRFTPGGKAGGTNWRGGWVGPRGKLLAPCFILVSCLIFSSTVKMEANRQLAFIGLQGVITQKYNFS